MGSEGAAAAVGTAPECRVNLSINPIVIKETQRRVAGEGVQLLFITNLVHNLLLKLKVLLLLLRDVTRERTSCPPV